MVDGGASEAAASHPAKNPFHKLKKAFPWSPTGKRSDSYPSGDRDRTKTIPASALDTARRRLRKGTKLTNGTHEEWRFIGGVLVTVGGNIKVLVWRGREVRWAWLSDFVRPPYVPEEAWVRMMLGDSQDWKRVVRSLNSAFHGLTLEIEGEAGEAFYATGVDLDGKRVLVSGYRKADEKPLISIPLSRFKRHPGFAEGLWKHLLQFGEALPHDPRVYPTYVDPREHTAPPTADDILPTLWDMRFVPETRALTLPKEKRDNVNERHLWPEEREIVVPHVFQIPLKLVPSSEGAYELGWAVEGTHTFDLKVFHDWQRKEVASQVIGKKVRFGEGDIWVLKTKTLSDDLPSFEEVGRALAFLPPWLRRYIRKIAFFDRQSMERFPFLSTAMEVPNDGELQFYAGERTWTQLMIALVWGAGSHVYDRLLNGTKMNIDAIDQWKAAAQADRVAPSGDAFETYKRDFIDTFTLYLFAPETVRYHMPHRARQLEAVIAAAKSSPPPQEGGSWMEPAI